MDESPLKEISIDGQLTNGETFEVIITNKLITLRVGDRICIAHPSWLTTAEALKLGDYVYRLVGNRIT